MTGSLRQSAPAVQFAFWLAAGALLPMTNHAAAERTTSTLHGLVSIEAAPCGAQPVGHQPCVNPQRPGAFVKLAVSDATDPAKVVAVTTDQSGAFRLVLPIGKYRIGLHHDMRDLLMTEQEVTLRTATTRSVGLKIKALAP